MKRQFIIALLALALSSCDVAYAQRRRPQAPEWQGAVEATVQLVVRDKYGELSRRDDVATFTVAAPDGQRFFATVPVKENTEAVALFPDDFPGAIIFRGTFAFQSSLTFGQPKRGKRK